MAMWSEAVPRLLHGLPFFILAWLPAQAMAVDSRTPHAPLPTALGLSCRTCHGVGENTAIPALPRDAAGLQRQLRELRDGKRQGSTMPRLLQGLSDEDIAHLARELTAAQEPAP